MYATAAQLRYGENALWHGRERSRGRAKVARRAGGTILDSHASLDPKMEPYLIDRKITCPDGTVRVGLTPDVAEERQGETQTGSWTIVSGTGAFEGLRGSGEMEIVYGPADDSPARETSTGTIMR